MASRTDDHPWGTCDGCGVDLGSVCCYSSHSFGKYDTLCQTCFKSMKDAETTVVGGSPVGGRAKGVRKMEREAEKWAKENPGAAGRADRRASIELKLTSEERLVLERLLDGPKATNKLTRSTRVSLRHLEKDLQVIDYDGDEWNLTEIGLEIAEAGRKNFPVS